MLLRHITVPALMIFIAAGTVQTQTTLSTVEKKQIADFERQAKAYISLRDKVRKKAPPVSKDATPAQIEAHKDALQKAVIAARAGAKQGDIFTPTSAPLIKRLIKTEFTDFEKSELRKQVLEADTKGVPIKVNAV